MKVFSNFSILVAALLTTVYAFTIVPNQQTKKTYYVDSVLGNDFNTGLTADAAWKSLTKINNLVFEPGDVILLKCNSTWDGQLLLKGSGVATNPITLSSYGKGKKPSIHGNGKFDQVILMEDVEGWQINNLELTNNASTIGNRTGILVRALGNQTKRYFRFTNLYIHDIMGDYSFETKGKNTGGIGIIGGPSTKFDDVIIENCELGNINRVGIFTNLTKGDQAKRGNRPFTKLIVRNNSIHHCAGDGAIIRYAYQPLIAHNLAYENHNGPENLVKHGVALWCRSTDEATFEYNEVHHTRGSMDGQAFDADLDSYRTLVQYNYSHDNEGGLMLVYGSSSEAIVRYNLSVDDGKKGKHIFDFPVWTSPRGSGIFHNNTIVLPKDSAVVIVDEALATAKFYNNIFYQQGNGKVAVKSEGKSAYFNNNGYFGYHATDLTDSAAIRFNIGANVLPQAAPLLKDTKIYAKPSAEAKNNKDIDVKNVAPNYWLPNRGTLDFRGKTINAKNVTIGAFQ